MVSVRTMTLLGKRDPGAKKAFFLLIGIASVLVAAYNVALLAASGAVTHAVSNDEAVRDAFGAILWVLLPHMQTRLSWARNASAPLGLSRMGSPGYSLAVIV